MDDLLCGVCRAKRYQWFRSFGRIGNRAGWLMTVRLCEGCLRDVQDIDAAGTVQAIEAEVSTAFVRLAA